MREALGGWGTRTSVHSSRWPVLSPATNLLEPYPARLPACMPAAGAYPFMDRISPKMPDLARTLRRWASQPAQHSTASY